MRILKASVLAVGLTLGLSVFVAPVMAQATKQPSAATVQMISEFKADPVAWLAAAKKAGNVAVSVQQMVGADPSLSQAIVDLAKQQNDPLLKANLAVGLAQAAGDLVQNGDQKDAQAIQQQIALAGDTALLNSFVAGSNTVQTASTGPGTTATGAGGTTGGGGGVGGITNNGTGSPSNSSSSGSSSGTTSSSNTTTTPTTNTTPTFTLASSTATTPTSTSSTSTSVSPSR